MREHDTEQETATTAKAEGGNATDILANPDDHMRLLAVNGAMLVAGIITRKPALARAGVRMAAAQGIAVALRTVFASRVKAAGRLTESEVSQGNADDEREADDAVPTGNSAAAIAVSKAAASGTGIPYVPARLFSHFVTGSNRPRTANIATDFIIGSVIGFIAERIARRVVPSLGEKTGPDAAD